MSAPGTDVAPPTASSSQSTPPGAWPTRPAAPTAIPTTRFVPTTRAGSCRAQRRSAGTRSVPRMRPMIPPRRPMTAPAITAALISGSAAGSGAEVRDRSGRGGKPRNRDIRAGRGSRVSCCGEEDREADIPQHEPEEAPDERHGEAPGADGDEDECVHSLEYVP